LLLFTIQRLSGIFFGPFQALCTPLNQNHSIPAQADLQTGSQRVGLSSVGEQPIPELLPDHSIDDVIHHEVKELGTHM
jgi:hypothetical protein